jgi:thiamine biosynthesis lipoprotein
LTLGVGALVVAAVPVALRRRLLVRRTVPVMGTLADLAVVHSDRRTAHAAIDAALAQLHDVERLMTRFNTTSDVGRINHTSGAEAVVVSPQTAAVLRAAVDLAHASEGAFDPCLGRSIELWDVAKRREPPHAAASKPLASRHLYRALDLGAWRGQPAVRVNDADVRIDLGGIAKGYGVDRAAATLREWGIRDAIVNVGGDLYTLGVAADGDPWEVGIRSPEHPDRIVHRLRITNRAVATSGTYLSFFEHGGRRYHHLLDPETGAPRLCTMQSLTITADDCQSADALGTAAFGREVGGATQFVADYTPGARVELVI